jgi:hypothetical protein
MGPKRAQNGPKVGSKNGPKSAYIGVWQGTAMDFLKFHLGQPCPTLVCPTGWPIRRAGSMRHAAVFFHLKHSTSHAYAHLRVKTLIPNIAFVTS